MDYIWRKFNLGEQIAMPVYALARNDMLILQTDPHIHWDVRVFQFSSRNREPVDSSLPSFLSLLISAAMALRSTPR